MQKQKTQKLVGVSLLVAITVVLQMLGSFIRFGPVSISLTLVPIVVGGALYGPGVGALLGFVFSLVVLATDCAAFYAVSIPGTILTVVLKGTLAGYLSALVYKVLAKKNEYVAVLLSSITAPVVNTGIFVIGCFLFFMPLLESWSGGGNVVSYVFFTLVGINFIVEAVINIALSNAIVRIIRIGRKQY